MFMVSSSNFDPKLSFVSVLINADLEIDLRKLPFEECKQRVPLRMRFELTNEQRKYLALELVAPHWERVQFTDETYLYFDGDFIRKRITLTGDSYVEEQLNDPTSDNRQVLQPRSGKGKSKKLTASTLGKRDAIGVAFYYQHLHVTITNRATQLTYYSTWFERKNISDLRELKAWLKAFIAATTDADLMELEDFKTAQRKRISVKEGDFFAYKVDRRRYGFGRVLLDIRPKQFRKNQAIDRCNHPGLDNIMGQPLVVKIYRKIDHVLPQNLIELANTSALPSQYIMDNNLFYGEFEIIGNAGLLPEELEFPLSYAAGIIAGGSRSPYLQWGLIHRASEAPVTEIYASLPNPFVPDGREKAEIRPFRNESVGWSLEANLPILEKCIEAGSNQPYWDQASSKIYFDLRNPHHDGARREIFEYFGLDPDLDYSANCARLD